MKARLEILGHIGKDCEVRHMDNGNAVINFSVATTEKYKDRNGTVMQRTLWVDCALWRKSDKIGVAEFLRKGMLVEVEGKPLPPNAWIGQSDGKPYASLIMRVSNIIFLSKKQTTDQPTAQSSSSVETTPIQEVDGQVFTASSMEEDLPF